MKPTVPNYRKRIPYGMSNFASVRRDDCYFVDKTEFIPELERAIMVY
ncbi:MAG: AAA family ATPase [Bacteroidaceae bacterium]|nr:AAA family ATPase [Bacteroidaceae bacterium]MBR6589148.1 AAA family ATPase [Bacteroidaceae bacterium]